jgi:hypothetical protein
MCWTSRREGRHQGAGHLVHGVAVLEPEQRVGSRHWSSGMGGMGHRHQVWIVGRRETQGHRVFAGVWL